VIERTEPQTAQAKQAAEEQWFASLNSRCQCNGRVPCGDKYKAVLQRIRAPGAMSSNEQRRKLLQALNTMRRPSGAGVCHSSATSAACDHVRTPRELLPRLYSSSSSVNTFPFVSQATADDVRAMRMIRSSHSIRPAWWAVLQPRLQLYAATGAGTVAEAIVYNDCFWLGQVAHEEASGARAQAGQRRRSSGGESTAAGSSSGSSGTSMAVSSSSSTDRADGSDNSATTAAVASSSCMTSNSAAAAAAAAAEEWLNHIAE
jgi:hypothetical protein